MVFPVCMALCNSNAPQYLSKLSCHTWLKKAQNVIKMPFAEVFKNIQKEKNTIVKDSLSFLMAATFTKYRRLSSVPGRLEAVQRWESKQLTVS